MRNFLTLASLCILISGLAFAQQSTTVTQQVDVQLVNVIKMNFTSTGTNTGSNINIPLSNITQLTNGVTSANQVITVNSTKPFNVNVKSLTPDFTYSGTYQNNTTMPVSNNLLLRVNQNYTGGSIGNGFSSYNSITSSTQNIINGGNTGTNKTFRVRYKATPGMNYPAGVYSTSIIYTATQQ